MLDKCNKCGSNKLFVEIQGKRRGLYCGECGKWQKWITKEELQIAKFKGLKIIEKLKKIKEDTMTANKCGLSNNDFKEEIEVYDTVLNLIAKLKKENKEKDKYIKNSENITTEMSNDINKLLLEIKEKDKQIDLMARAFKQDDVRSVEEIKEYFEELAKEEGE